MPGKQLKDNKDNVLMLAKDGKEFV